MKKLTKEDVKVMHEECTAESIREEFKVIELSKLREVVEDLIGEIDDKLEDMLESDRELGDMFGIHLLFKRIKEAFSELWKEDEKQTAK